MAVDDGLFDGAIRFGCMYTVVEAALAEERIELFEPGSKLIVFQFPNAIFTHRVNRSEIRHL